MAVGGDLATVIAGLACGEANTIGWKILRDYATFVSLPGLRGHARHAHLRQPAAWRSARLFRRVGAVTLGLLSLFMQAPSLASARAALGLDAQSRVLLVSTEGDTDLAYLDIVWVGEIPSYGLIK